MGRRTTIDLTYRLEGDYLDEFTKRMGDVITEMESAIDEKKLKNSILNATIKNAKETLHKMNLAIKDGFEIVSVAAIEEKDLDTKTKFYYDVNDPTKLLTTRPFGEHEQLTLEHEEKF